MASSAWSIRKHLLVLVGASALPIAIFSVAALVLLHNQQYSSERERLVSRAQAISLDVDRELLAVIRVLQVLATSMSLEQGNLRQFGEEAARAITAHRGWDVISMIDASGAMVMNTRIPFGSPLPKPAIPKMVSDVFASVQPQVSDLLTGTLSKQPLLAVAVPVLSNGRVKYSLGLGMSPAFVTDILLEEKLSAGWLAAVLDRNQAIIARTRDVDRLLGKTAGPAFAARSQEGGGGFFLDTTRDGIPVAAAFRRSELTGWTTGLSIPIAELEAPLNRLLVIHTGAGIVLLLLGTALAFWFGGRITASFDQLSRAAANIGKGEMPKVAPLQVAEANDLARSFEDAAAERAKAEAALRESEARYRQFVEHSPDPMFAHFNGLIVLANAAMEELLGAAPGQLLGMAILDFIAPADREIVKARIARVVHDLPVPRAEVGFVRLDGSVVPVEAAASPIRHQGEPAVLVTVRDITERKRADTEIRETSRRLGTLIDNLPGVAYRCRNDPVWTTEFVNQGILGLTGYASVEFSTGRIQIGNLILAEDRDRVWETVQHAVEAKSRYEIEYRMRTVSGEIKWVWERGCGVYGEDGVLLALEGFVTDVTDRRRAEEALHESETRLRNVLDNMFPFVGLLSLDGRVLEANRAPLEAAGLAREDVIGKPCVEIWWFSYSPEVQERLRAALARAAAGEVVRYDEAIRIAGGRFITIDLMFSPLRDAEGRVSAIVGSAIDITERSRAQEALRESEEKLRLFVDHAPSAIAMFDRDMRYVAFSRRWLRDYGLGDRDISGLSHYEVFPDLPERWKEIHRKCLAGAIEKAEEDPFPRADGSIDWVRWEVHPWRARDGGIGGIIIFSEVVTERKQAQDALRELSRRLLEVEEAERRAISRELHDRIGQNISALNLNLGIIRGQLPKGSPRAVIERFDDARKLLETTSQQVRDVMSDLRPAALDDYGLLAALRAYAEPYSRRVGIPLSVNGSDLAPRPPLATETALFRIAQEALNNTAKHARARQVEVTLAQTPHGVSLTVADDGVGFDPQEITGSRLHWGLTTMRERAEAISAALRVESAPGKGTRVVVEVATANPPNPLLEKGGASEASGGSSTPFPKGGREDTSGGI